MAWSATALIASLEVHGLRAALFAGDVCRLDIGNIGFLGHYIVVDPTPTCRYAPGPPSRNNLGGICASVSDSTMLVIAAAARSLRVGFYRADLVSARRHRS
jgi:hypothetical protein